MLVGEKIKIKTKFWAAYKTGTGTRGQGDGDIGTLVWELWDLETRDEGLGDIKYGTWGRVGRGRGRSNTGRRGCE